MNQLMLSERLKTVATYIPKKANFADIGSDHAYLPCYVCTKDIEAKAIAGEVNEGPFQSAVTNVKHYNLSSRIDVRKGNGLAILKESEVEQIVIAGMGGSLITTILEEGKAKLDKVNRIITQPNVDASSIRTWFYQNGFDLVKERIVKEDGHIYEVLVADRGNANSNYHPTLVKKQLLFGPLLLQEKSEPFIEKWQVEKDRKERAVKQMMQAKELDHAKLDCFKEEIQMIKEVLS
ncbi:tRNA (adenine(22)-N(1))-methyltransferase [Aquibacillus salsiterrae]|uniref:tRNA (Adenine(22)-N(1))-methyltransferase TrmK n=1 Tax=Aquibacillus salsiterrae TaxID=2950439 RepID=A0A9X3WDQ1_9BACI|nr:tRNA (adenine(22)-N(1))-methyltransferase TrmK [Aquibacillus salsiterrae]MDC3415544.1 tRNA (adenine(22)-N(1))-methyltransferase TrmK [Aquibacillus salsiterrae]